MREIGLGISQKIAIFIRIILAGGHDRARWHTTICSRYVLCYTPNKPRIWRRSKRPKVEDITNIKKWGRVQKIDLQKKVQHAATVHVYNSRKRERGEGGDVTPSPQAQQGSEAEARSPCRVQRGSTPKSPTPARICMNRPIRTMLLSRCRPGAGSSRDDVPWTALWPPFSGHEEGYHLLAA